MKNQNNVIWGWREGAGKGSVHWVLCTEDINLLACGHRQSSFSFYCHPKEVILPLPSCLFFSFVKQKHAFTEKKTVYIWYSVKVCIDVNMDST